MPNREISFGELTTSQAETFIRLAIIDSYLEEELRKRLVQRGFNGDTIVIDGSPFGTTVEVSGPDGETITVNKSTITEARTAVTWAVMNTHSEDELRASLIQGGFNDGDIVMTGDVLWTTVEVSGPDGETIVV